MPYFYDQNLEDQEDQDPSQVQISGASPTTESMGSDDDSQGGGGGEKKELVTGSGFQNLDKYLQTNQSKEFGQQVLGKVESEVEGAQQNQDQASQKFQDQVSSLNKTPTSDQVNSAIANPVGANKDEFQGWMKQNYQGAKNLAETPDLWNQYWSGSNKANTAAQQLGTEAGRFSLLDSYFGKPSYNFGEKSLDNLLVQQSGLGKETRNLQNEATQLRSKGEVQAQGLQNAASQKAAAVDQSRAAVLKAIGLDAQGNVLTGADAGAIGKQYEDVYGDVRDANSARKAEQDALKDLVGKGSLTDQELKDFGLSRGGGVFTHDPFGRPIADYDPSGYKPGDQLFNLNLSNYTNYGGELGRDEVMSPEQRAYIRALSQLSGIEDTFAQNEHVDPSKAFGFDTARFLSDQRNVAEAVSNEQATLVQAYRNKDISWDTYLKARDALLTRYQVNKRIGKADPLPAAVTSINEDNLSPRIRGR